jgi:hypothetical protein
MEAVWETWHMHVQGRLDDKSPPSPLNGDIRSLIGR